jgi:NADH/NAD ratio-sensing transcriptional regulator Rex
MTLSEILNIVLPSLMTAVIIPLLVAVGKAVSNYFKEKTNSEKLQKYFDMANDAIVTAVAEVMQTFVETMKREGAWNKEAAEKAFELAKMRAIEIMGVAALQALPEIVGDVEAWIISKIEAATLQTKQGIQVMRTLGGTPCASFT